jgi:DNA-binding beta-propeller fold protein YncE
MPHGSRITEDGKFQYHVSMMTDELMEINTARMDVSRRLNIAKGSKSINEHSGTNHSRMAKPQAKPTWADPHPTKNLVYIANNGSDEIVEVDTEQWKVKRRFATDNGTSPYNLEVTNDGKYVVASYKGSGETGIWNLKTGKEVAIVKNSRNVTHGVATTPDSQFAFISVEGIGGEPGSVDVINLQTMERADVVEIGKQAGGIIFWKTTD